MDRRLISSGSPFEPVAGYSRAVRVGPHVFVAGTAAVMPDGADPPTDAYGQARRCLEIILRALEDAGASAEHVVRTRLYATSADMWDDVARAHGEVFSEVRPASSFIVIRGLADPKFIVEIEAEALVP